MYEGRTAAEPGITFGTLTFSHPSFHLLTTLGHENMGIVEQLGEGVTLLKKGDRVVMPFNVADGRCRNCEEGKTAFCTGVNPGFAGGAYGYVAMGPYRGGQAQYIRVPYADFNALKLPAGKEHEADFILLAGKFSLVVGSYYLADIIKIFSRPAGTELKSQVSDPAKVWLFSALAPSVSWPPTQLFSAVPPGSLSSTVFPSDSNPRRKSAARRLISPRVMLWI
jgi:hypothetical protein